MSKMDGTETAFPVALDRPETFTCPRHGVVISTLEPSEARERGLPVACPQCVSQMEGRSSPATMSGDDRAAEVVALLTDKLTVDFALVQERIYALVGRDVWTHEMVNPGVLAEEARDWRHPANLKGHLIGTLRDAVGDKPIIVIDGEEKP